MHGSENDCWCKELNPVPCSTGLQMCRTHTHTADGPDPATLLCRRRRRWLLLLCAQRPSCRLPSLLCSQSQAGQPTSLPSTGRSSPS